MYKLEKLGVTGSVLVSAIFLLFDTNTFAQERNKNEIDSVLNYHFRALSKIVQLREGETLPLDLAMDFRASVIFLEKLTGIKSTADQSFLGKTFASEEELKKWEEWVKGNRRLIIWQSRKARVNRKDINIY